jgi:hypothetical protein
MLLLMRLHIPRLKPIITLKRGGALFPTTMQSNIRRLHPYPLSVYGKDARRWTLEFSRCSISLLVYREVYCYKLSFQTCSITFWSSVPLETLANMHDWNCLSDLGPTLSSHGPPYSLALQPSSMGYVPPGLFSISCSEAFLPFALLFTPCRRFF